MRTLEDNMRSKRNFLEELARDAGKLMLENWQKDVDIYEKADQTIVTEVDLQISKLVCDRIKESYPESAILTEETHKELYFPKETGFIIDELDGTFSFANGRSGFNFQCAYYEDYGDLQIGLIYDPLEDIVLSAIKDEGVILNKRGVKTKIEPFPHKKWEDLRFGHHRIFMSNTHKIMYQRMGVTEEQIISTGSVGSKVIDLVQGNFEVLIALNRKIAAWDWAPGKVIIEELNYCLYHLTGQEVELSDPREENPYTFGYLACPVDHLPRFQKELKWISDKLTRRRKQAIRTS
jgi:myo-inositol-1(or 4)-monophosphatase